jgi:cytidyltransferase-like protein
MDNLNDLNNFLNEKKIVVKRRYTEAYPAKNVSTNARIRSVILDAISDGHITEEEMSRILSELRANKRWLGRNKTLFNISEDQAGIKTFSLSPYGLRVKNKTTVLNEALNVPHKEKGKKPVNMFVGRFQPFTLGHVKVFEKMYKENGLPVVVYMVRGGKADPEKRPFDEDMQQAMFAKMKKQYPFLEASIVVPNGAIDTMFAAARPAYEPMMWGYGTDRKKSYGAMINKQSYRDELGVDPSFKGFEIKRGDENISASKVRNALKIDDEKTFKKMTPKSIHKFYKPLQTIMQPIKENENMKNLKSLTDFSINEEYVIVDAIDPKAQNLKRLLKKHKVTMKVVDPNGAAGFPVVELTGDRKDLEKVLASDNGWADPDLAEFIEEGLNSSMVKVELINEAKFNKKSLMKKMKKDDGMIQLGNGEEYVIYAFGNGNDDNDSMWGDKTIFALDQDGGEHEIEYSDIVSYNESKLNEEYIELMRGLEEGLEEIVEGWIEWKSGPATEKSDIAPARKELLNFCTTFLKKNIK